ncbi:MAG: Protein translocase subunit SecE [Verrucomicrobiae bacterium]|nr:Protein translocase subunit SecE [Verrucomicrobiae bacterium]
MAEELQKKSNLVTKVKEFCNEVVVELKKSSWPTRKELIDSTVIVIVTMIVLGIFVAFADVVFVKIVGMLTKSA